MSRRGRLGLWTAGVLAVLGAAHTVLWFRAAAEVRTGYEAAVAAYAAQGWQVSAGPPRRVGWPLAAGLMLPGPVVTDGTVRWTAERAAVQVSLLRPGVVEVVPAGRQTLSLPGLAPLAGEAEAMTLALPLDGAGPGALRLRGLLVPLPAGEVRVASTAARFMPDGSSVVLEGTGILLPEPWRLLDGAIEAASARLLLSPPPPLAGTPANRAALWRRTGGTLRLAESALRWGALSVAGGGVLRLDARLQPEGEGTLTVAGQDAALDGAVRVGLLPARGAAAGKAVLALLSAGAGGGPVAVPVQLQDGVLLVARFPLVQVPGLAWGGR